MTCFSRNRSHIRCQKVDCFYYLQKAKFREITVLVDVAHRLLK